MLDQAATTDIDIRIATSADLSAIVRLLAPFRPDAETARLSETVAGLLEGYGSAILVAGAPELVGLAVLTEHRVPASLIRPARRFVEIEQLEVIESHRGEGIGALLIAAAERWAAGRGHAALELTLGEADAAAAALCDRTGFRAATRRLSKVVMAA